MTFQLRPCPDPLIHELYATAAKGCIPREEGDYLYSLVRYYRPEATIEIGMANGLSTLFIAAAHRDNGGTGRHIAIDPFQATAWNNQGVKLMHMARLSHLVRLVDLPSHQGLPALEQERIRAGMVFIDGAHLTDYVFADFLVADRLLEVGGLIAFDDAHWPAVRPVPRYAITNRAYVVAHPEVIIWPQLDKPRRFRRFFRTWGRRVSWLRSRLRHDYLHRAEDLGVAGRCVVLRKTQDDYRDSQNPDHHWDY